MTLNRNDIEVTIQALLTDVDIYEEQAREAFEDDDWPAGNHFTERAAHLRSLVSILQRANNVEVTL